MRWEPHQTAFTTWQLASGKTESTTITRRRWIQHLARTYPSETALTVTEDQVTQWLANPAGSPPPVKALSNPSGNSSGTSPSLAHETTTPHGLSRPYPNLDTSVELSRPASSPTP